MTETKKMSYYQKYNKLLVVLVAVFLFGCSGDDGKDGIDGIDGIDGQTGPAAVLIVPDEIEGIQQAIDSIATNGGGTVYIKAGKYVLSQGIHINNSNITISGEQGVLIKLNDNVNQPVILIGSDVENPSDTIENIKIEGLEIDGNKDGQTFETDPNRTWIRNNGIYARMVSNLYVSEVDVHHARNSGFVVDLNSSLIFIDKSNFHHNDINGMGIYASRDIQVTNFFCNDNKGNGLRLNNDVRYVMFSTGIIRNNAHISYTHGIYATYSRDVKFQDLIISNNQSHGCFLAHNSYGTGTGVIRLTFNSCSFMENDGYGLWLASEIPDSRYTSIISSIFSGNIYGAISIGPMADIYYDALIIL
jgi:hypothetical protein